MLCNVSEYERDGAFLFGNLDGRKVEYTYNTQFTIQTGIGAGRYTTKSIVRGNLTAAVLQYNAITLRPNSKKRLMMSGCDTPLSSERA